MRGETLPPQRSHQISLERMQLAAWAGPSGPAVITIPTRVMQSDALASSCGMVTQRLSTGQRVTFDDFNYDGSLPRLRSLSAETLRPVRKPESCM